MKNIYHEGKLINKAGVDRVVLSHVELKKINWPVFKKAITASSDIIYDAFRSANRIYYVTEGGDRLHYMTITDPEVGHLNFGANPKKYGIIEFSPANKNNGINIVNFDGKELMEYLAHIKVILSDRYGLEVSFTNCTLKEVELNVTFALNHPYDDYYRALSVLFSDMPYLKKQCEYTGKENKEKQLQSCSAFNKQLSVTAYNKSVEMAIALKRKEEIHITDENGVLIESDLMRVEFKLKTAEVCKKWFDGLNTFGDLKEEMIDKAFKKLVNYYLLFPLVKWETENARYLKRTVKDFIKNSGRGYGWKTKLLTDLRNEELKEREVKLLALDDLNKIILHFKDKSGHRKRLQVSEDFSGLARADIFLQRDREKLNEIVNNLKCFVSEESLTNSMRSNGSDKN